MQLDKVQNFGLHLINLCCPCQLSFSDSTRRRCSVLQWNPDLATQLVVASDDDDSPSLRVRISTDIIVLNIVKDFKLSFMLMYSFAFSFGICEIL